MLLWYKIPFHHIFRHSIMRFNFSFVFLLCNRIYLMRQSAGAHISSYALLEQAVKQRVYLCFFISICLNNFILILLLFHNIWNWNNMWLGIEIWDWLQEMYMNFFYKKIHSKTVLWKTVMECLHFKLVFWENCLRILKIF